MIEKSVADEKKKIVHESYECKSKLNIAPPPHPFFLFFFFFSFPLCLSFLVVNGSVAYTINHV